ncbi:hypothetical protein P9X10_00375 [Bacillus cereus]|nr:hypothetical protein [Bacillus cereus]
MDELRANEGARGVKGNNNNYQGKKHYNNTRYSHVSRDKTISLQFITEPVTFLREEYADTMSHFLKRFERHDNVESVTCHFSKSSESVYVMVQYENREGHLLFSIKNHKEYRATSIKVFTVTKFYDMAHLGRAVGKFIEKAKTSETLLFNFKFGTFLGLNSIYKLANKGYQITTAPSNYLGDLSREVFITSKVNLGQKTLITDKIFLDRLKKLVFCGLVRGFYINDGIIRFYISVFGSELYSQNEEKFKKQFELEYGGIDGLIEDSITKSGKTTSKPHKKQGHNPKRGSQGSHGSKTPYKKQGSSQNRSGKSPYKKQDESNSKPTYGKKPYNPKGNGSQNSKKPYVKKNNSTK